MFARYIGEDGFGLIPKEIYYINVNEQLVQQQRKLSITVGDFWACDYSSFGEAMTEWEFTWQTEQQLENLSLEELMRALNSKLFSPNGRL